MLNILTKALPDAILINGVELSILTDFRLWISVGEVFRQSSGMEIIDVIDELAELIVSREIPPDIHPEDFISGVIDFYKGYPRMVGKSKRDAKPAKARKPDYDFLADSEFIYSSFVQVYGIRLTMVEMHWWEFLTLFDGLMFAEQNAINFVIGTRQADVKKASKEERARLNRLKKDFELPKDESDAKAEANLTDILMGGKKKDGR